MKSNKYTLDRFEGDLAVLLLRDDESIEKVIPMSKLGKKFHEGDILLVTFEENEKVLGVQFLEKETIEYRQKAKELLSKLKSK